MVRRVNWTDQALADLADIKRYIERRSPANARKVVDRIAMEGDRLGEFPYAAREIPEFRDPDRRETFVYNWRIMFRVEPGQVTIRRVVHAKRKLNNVPGSFEEIEQDAYLADLTAHQPSPVAT